MESVGGQKERKKEESKQEGERAEWEGKKEHDELKTK